MPLPADFDYGNARLRARKAGLLGRSDYDELLGKDLDGQLAALAETPYGPDLKHAAGRATGLRALHEAVRGHIARSLEEVRGFYQGRARALLDLILSRWDLDNLLSLLRGAATGATAEETTARIVPIGRLDEAAATEAAAQPDLERVVELLVSWRLPSADMARALARAWPAYLRTEDLAALEHSLTAEYFGRASALAGGFGDEAGPLRRDLARAADVRNALAVLRLRDAAERGEDELQEHGDQLFVPGGRVRSERLVAALESGGSEQAASALAEATPEVELREGLTRWVPGDGVVALQRELEARLTRAAVGEFRTGDPLGAGIPLAFTVAKTSEARNLRLLADGAAREVDPDELRSKLVLAEDESR
jgi:V/A-type H+/Na+-transporting ATPase subunit C